LSSNSAFFSAATPPAQRVQFILGEENRTDTAIPTHPLFSEMEELCVGEDGNMEWKETARYNTISTQFHLILQFPVYKTMLWSGSDTIICISLTFIHIQPFVPFLLPTFLQCFEFGFLLISIR
jgi:hypothetical protein